MGKSSGGSGVVIIKKYANRRLYDTDSSSYITLEHLAVMTRAGREFKVIDAKSEEDITHNVLTQIIMEEETRGQTMLPVGFLRQLIGLYGDNMQSMVPQYLEASMDAFKRNQLQFRSAMEGAFSGGPFAEIAKRNLEMFEVAASAFKPPLTPGGVGAPGDPVPAGTAAVDEEISALKEQVAALQARIDTHKG
ncbi:polyhydroxyalkanoate synthesis repressor PhaR [Sphingomonas montana]|uniref:polyhydroxyalkanoate synthesis repressor PhaR n=1 Tax=Sphingomonas montana TaxID=1843236 RepID=UPI00096CA68A|nr:polyhydroxyalkanoate synthesis repressor PhaR [Sphingomonas montana]